MPRASIVPNATHNRTAPAPLQADGGAVVSPGGIEVGSGDTPATDGVGRGELSLSLTNTPRNHSAVAETSITTNARTNHRRERCNRVMPQL